MTKWYPNNTKANQYADRPIAIANSEDDEPEIICPSCHCNTVVKVDSDDYCTRCKHTFNVKREVEIETGKIVESDNMDDNSETLISELPDALDAYYGRSKPEYQGGIAELQRRGIHISSYVERGGDGRITNSWNDGSNSSSDSQRRISAPRPFKEVKESEE